MPGQLYIAKFNPERFEKCVKGNYGSYVPHPKIEVDPWLGLVGCARAMAILKRKFAGKQTAWGCIAAPLTKAQMTELFQQLYQSTPNDATRAIEAIASLKDDYPYLLVALET